MKVIPYVPKIQIFLQPPMPMLVPIKSQSLIFVKVQVASYLTKTMDNGPSPSLQCMPAVFYDVEIREVGQSALCLKMLVSQSIHTIRTQHCDNQTTCSTKKVFILIKYCSQEHMLHPCSHWMRRVTMIQGRPAIKTMYCRRRTMVYTCFWIVSKPFSVVTLIWKAFLDAMKPL